MTPSQAFARREDLFRKQKNGDRSHRTAAEIYRLTHIILGARNG